MLMPFVKRAMSSRRFVGATCVAVILVSGVLSYGRCKDRSGRSDEHVWSAVTGSAPWSPQHGFSAVVHGDRLWLFGKSDGVWSSADGVAWSQVAGAAEKPSGENVYVALNDAVFAIGGAPDRVNRTSRTVHSTRDGIQWRLLTDHPPWSARTWHACAVFRDRIWVLGGYDGDYRSDVWSSANGAEWRCETAAAPWKGRGMHAAVVFADRLWVLAGRRNVDGWFEKNFNDVWSTDDGVHWRQETAGAKWSKRFGVGAAAWDRRLWVMGGARSSIKRDFWWSQDGRTWTSGGTAPWLERFNPAVAVFDDRLWLMGGKYGGGRFFNDVWRLDHVAGRSRK